MAEKDEPKQPAKDDTSRPLEKVQKRDGGREEFSEGWARKDRHEVRDTFEPPDPPADKGSDKK